MTAPVKPFATATALRLLKLFPNWYFFRIDPGTKDGGLPTAWNTTGNTNDPKVISKWPVRSNVGLALRKSGLIVADVDVKPGKRGADTLDELELVYGTMPETYSVRTGSGGTHYYYFETDTAKHVQRQNTFGPDIDSPGFVLIAGCQFEGKLYTTITKAPKLTPAPSWFAEYLIDAAPGTGDNSSQAPAVEQDTPDIIAHAIDYIKHDAKPSIQFRNGEFTLLMTAAVLKDMGISKYMAIELIAEYYNVPGKCEPLWELGEGAVADRLDIKVENAWNYLKQTQPGANTPRAAFGDDPLPPANDDDERAVRLRNTTASMFKRVYGRRNVFRRRP
jgi:hypothetical protein